MSAMDKEEYQDTQEYKKVKELKKRLVAEISSISEEKGYVLTSTLVAAEKAKAQCDVSIKKEVRIGKVVYRLRLTIEVTAFAKLISATAVVTEESKHTLFLLNSGLNVDPTDNTKLLFKQLLELMECIVNGRKQKGAWFTSKRKRPT